MCLVLGNLEFIYRLSDLILMIGTSTFFQIDEKNHDTTSVHREFANSRSKSVMCNIQYFSMSNFSDKKLTSFVMLSCFSPVLDYLIDHWLFTAASWIRAPVSACGKATTAKSDKLDFPGLSIHTSSQTQFKLCVLLASLC